MHGEEMKGEMSLAQDRDLKLGEYEISGNRYRELKYFCRQHEEKKQRLREMTEISSPSFAHTRGGKIADRTGDTAVSRVQLQRDIETVEQAAIETDSGIYTYLLRNVTEGVPYEYLGVPLSIASFYRRRRKFFWILDKKKK